MENQNSKVWFITGASRGFGRVWADAALKRGDKVAATARKLESIADLKEKYGENVLTLELDVTKSEQVKTAVEEMMVVDPLPTEVAECVHQEAKGSW